jgi:transcription initiation factor TFIID TATA-box-binding protein
MRKRKYVPLPNDSTLFHSLETSWDDTKKDSSLFHTEQHYIDSSLLSCNNSTLSTLDFNEPTHLNHKKQKKNSVVQTWPPTPKCHNIVSTSQIQSSQGSSLNLQRLADLYPFTTYDRKRFAAITIRLANPHCTCLLFGSGKLVITGSTSFSACIVASHEITKILRKANPRDWFEVSSCIIQNIVAHVELPSDTFIDLNRLYTDFCECATYQRSIFPGLVLRPPQSPIVLLIFNSGRIVCTGGKSYDDIYFGFINMFHTIKKYIKLPGIQSIKL